MRFKELAIRLRLKLVKKGNSVEVTALVNSKYETLEPEILVGTLQETYPCIPNFYKEQL